MTHVCAVQSVCHPDQDAVTGASSGDVDFTINNCNNYYKVNISYRTFRSETGASSRDVSDGNVRRSVWCGV
ncbi:jg20364 [Pararge aegeria aegeria]|uniref:Jg20364 protein n=1 Tax=Pararge aegeria aegeria TaxID=348720 RepID=A0A8S4RA71_9NEOP|nr:jg20364 [Pararge aegeria aegeria]